jgi:hypothetical protein
MYAEHILGRHWRLGLYLMVLLQDTSDHIHNWYGTQYRVVNKYTDHLNPTTGVQNPQARSLF